MTSFDVGVIFLANKNLVSNLVSTWPHQLEDVEESQSVDSGLLC